MQTVTTREAQHHFSRVLDMLADSGEVVITRRGQEVAKLVSIDQKNPFEKTMNWGDMLEERKKALGDMPQLEGDTMAILREEERF